MALPKHLPSHPRGSFSRLLARLRLLTNPRGSPPPRGIRDERRGTVSRVAGTLDSSLLPLGLDLSSMINPGTPPEYLVIAVWDLLPSLPIGCELFGENDLDVIGSRCINAGGFADVWMGKMNNGTTVAIKSYRYYSSSSCLSIYIVSTKRNRVCYLLTVIQSGCTTRRWRAVSSATAARVSSHSWGFIPPRNIHSPSFSS